MYISAVLPYPHPIAPLLKKLNAMQDPVPSSHRVVGNAVEPMDGE